MRPVGRPAAVLVGAAVAAAAARLCYALPARARRRWVRTNFRGARVTLLEGPALAAGVCAGVAAAPGMPGRMRAAALTAAAGAAGFGAYDDVSGNGGARGLRGHLASLVRGAPTTGAVKVAGIGATGCAAAALLGRKRADIALDGALIAGCANLVNLFDLRPGRAAKVALAAGAAGLGGPAGGASAAVCGAAAVLLPDDLAERAMLGDTGANAMGAVLGTAAAASLPRPARTALLAGVVALTAASEAVSFSAVIRRTPMLRRLDDAGRRSASATAAAEPQPVPVPEPSPEPAPPARSGTSRPAARTP